MPLFDPDVFHAFSVLNADNTCGQSITGGDPLNAASTRCWHSMRC